MCLAEKAAGIFVPCSRFTKSDRKTYESYGIFVYICINDLELRFVDKGECKIIIKICGH